MKTPIRVIVPAVAILTAFGLGVAYNVSSSEAKLTNSNQVIEETPVPSPTPIEATNTNTTPPVTESPSVSPTPNRTEAPVATSPTPAQTSTGSDTESTPTPTPKPQVNNGDPIGTVYMTPGSNGGNYSVIAP